MSDKITSYNGQTIILPAFARKQFHAFALDCLTETEGAPLTDDQRWQLRRAYSVWLARKQEELGSALEIIGKYELYALLTETRYELNIRHCLRMLGIRRTKQLQRLLPDGQV